MKTSTTSSKFDHGRRQSNLAVAFKLERVWQPAVTAVVVIPEVHVQQTACVVKPANSLVPMEVVARPDRHVEPPMEHKFVNRAQDVKRPPLHVDPRVVMLEWCALPLAPIFDVKRLLPQRVPLPRLRKSQLLSSAIRFLRIRRFPDLRRLRIYRFSPVKVS